MAHRIVIGTYPGAEKSEHWPHILELLKLAAEGDGPVWGPGEVVWVAIEDGEIVAAVTTAIRPDGRAQLLCVGGRRLLRVLPEFETAITKWARDAGAGEIVARKGRVGWRRFACGWTLDAEVDGEIAYRKAVA